MDQTINNQKRIAYVQATWHRDIVDQARLAFIAECEDQGINRTQIDSFDVPGSLEIPLQCKLLAKSGKYDVIICGGLIVDGGIYRHDFVAGTVLDAMMQVQLDTEVPILSVVLTPNQFQETQAHKEFFFDHFKIKGKEAATACIETLQNIDFALGIIKAA